MRDVKKVGAQAQTMRAEQRYAAARKPNRRRNKRNMALYHLMVVVFVLLAGTLLSVTVFFNVSSVVVAGDCRYTQDDIIAASGIQKGDNLFRLNTDKAAKKIMDSMIYLERVTIERKLPDTAQIVVEPAVAFAGVESGGSYYLISEGGRVLEAGLASPPADVITFYGFEPNPAQPGDTLTSVQTLKQDLITAMVASLAKAGIADVNSVDVTDRLNIKLSYQGRIIVELGAPSDLDYKLTFTKELLLNQIADYERGTIDFHSSGSSLGASFIPDHTPVQSADTQTLPEDAAGVDATQGGTSTDSGDG